MGTSIRGLLYHETDKTTRRFHIMLLVNYDAVLIKKFNCLACSSKNVS